LDPQEAEKGLAMNGLNKKCRAGSKVIGEVNKFLANDQ
jgi:hypothetical protein